MKTSKHKRKRRPPEAVKRQAQRVYEHTVFTEVLAGDLIGRFARRIGDDFTRGTLLFDYRMIVKALAAGDPETKYDPNEPPKRGMWERYAYQFQTEDRRRKLFAEIERIAKRYLANIVFCQVDASLHRTKMQPPEFIWDATLLPGRTAPYLLRQWISDSATTRKFLTALFRQFVDVSQKGSIPRRALIAAHAAGKLGLDWVPREITGVLIKRGDISLGQHENPAEAKIGLDRAASTVGRAIRRMRDADEKRRAKINTERRRQRTTDRAAVKRERLLRAARADLVTCLAGRRS